MPQEIPVRCCTGIAVATGMHHFQPALVGSLKLNLYSGFDKVFFKQLLLIPFNLISAIRVLRQPLFSVSRLKVFSSYKHSRKEYLFFIRLRREPPSISLDSEEGTIMV